MNHLGGERLHAHFMSAVDVLSLHKSSRIEPKTTRTYNSQFALVSAAGRSKMRGVKIERPSHGANNTRREDYYLDTKDLKPI